MLAEDYVSFETAKLLKEKGFDKDVLITDWWYDAEGQMHKRGNYSYGGAPFYDKETCFNCPTLQMAMKWLREVHALHVYIGRDPEKSRWYSSIDIVDIKQEDDSELLNRLNGFFYMGSGEYNPSYEEVCEAAIKFCLENLI